MNILITSAGRRVKIIKYFKKTFHKIGGKVIAIDCDRNAPAIHFADDYEIVPRIDDPNYIETLIDICKKHQIRGVVSLIDPELELLARHKEIFNKQSIQLVLSPLHTIEMTFDKFETYKWLSSKGIPVVPTYNNLDEVEKLLEDNVIKFPFVVKPAKGSASIGIETVYTIEELKQTFQKGEGLIIQPFFKDKEFGVDVYLDMKTGDLVDLFMKEKIRMRSGETDKSISVFSNQLESLILQLVKHIDFRGPIDVDCFEYEGEYYISEINPRFGGGYPHAYEMGCNFMEYILINLQGKENDPYNDYMHHKKSIMMKFDDLKLIDVK